MQVDATKLAALILNLEPGEIGDSEKLQAVISNYATTINTNDGLLTTHKTTATLDHPNGSVTKIKTVGGALVRSATIVVAASDSSDAGKAAADYVCDGVADQSEINLALNALYLAGGCVVLLEGTYIISKADNIRSFNPNTHLRGQGPGTILKFADSINAGHDMIFLSEQSNITISDMTLDGNKDNQTSGIQSGITSTLSAGVHIYNVACINFRQNGISAGGTSGLKVEKCTLENNTNGLYVTQSSRIKVRGNDFIDNTAKGLWIGVQNSNAIITDNEADGNGEEGIYANGSNYCVISNNLATRNGQSAHNTYANILLTNSMGNSTVQGNICRKLSLIEPKYGISAGGANLVTNNDLYNSGATASLFLSNGSVITTAGNRLT